MRVAAILIAALVLSLAGCRPTIDYPDVYADLACETAYAILKDRAEVHPSPPPAPPAPNSDKCQACNGTGLMPTDGRIRIECQECRGTGKKTKSVLVQPACKDGSCRR